MTLAPLSQEECEMRPAEASVGSLLVDLSAIKAQLASLTSGHADLACTLDRFQERFAAALIGNGRREPTGTGSHVVCSLAPDANPSSASYPSDDGEVLEDVTKSPSSQKICDAIER